MSETTYTCATCGFAGATEEHLDANNNPCPDKAVPAATEAAGTTLADVSPSAEFANMADAGHIVERTGETSEGSSASPEEHDRNP